MTEDPIVAEVRRHRLAIAERFNNDLDALGAYLRQRERAGGHKVAQPPKRKPTRGRKRSGSAAKG